MDWEKFTRMIAFELGTKEEKHFEENLVSQANEINHDKKPQCTDK